MTSSARAGATSRRSTTRPPHTPYGRVFGAATLIAAVVAVIVLAFSWPAITSEPKDLPVAISGTDAAVEQVETAVDERAEGAVALERVDDRDAAVAAIERREAYGAIILGDAPTDAPEVLIATAASPAVAQLLTGLAAQLQDQIDAQVDAQVQAALERASATIQALVAGQAPPAGQTGPGAGSPGAAPEIPQITVEVTDVVPLADSDPRGTGLVAAIFPLVLGGLAGGIALTLLVIGAVRRVVAVAVYSTVAGLALAGILQGWYGVLQGDYWLNAGAIALAIAAIAAPITGFAALMGRPGIALGVVTFILVANPISAAAVPVEFLLEPWGAVGQWFPPGAAATLLRDLSYFPDADTTFPWLVLVAWAVGGVLLSFIGHFRTAGGAEPDALAAHADDVEADAAGPVPTLTR
ncbi:hypothetical protein [Agromyces bauzanensis]|uniref:ABC transporter permease n=1 Tax=Agromyces bauzanensis TaxID=1308924 RepID=A0A917PG36_9MICO|nr:hypothetical protein [Agromyces bauzanensis]GGJ75707.1 hypothetical protein GCM10011372_12340 [Agromyces bauzanensis]